MKKLLLLSVIFAMVAIPVRAARNRDGRQGLRRTLWGVALFQLFYLVNLLYLQQRL